MARALAETDEACEQAGCQRRSKDRVVLGNCSHIPGNSIRIPSRAWGRHDEAAGGQHSCRALWPAAMPRMRRCWSAVVECGEILARTERIPPRSQMGKLPVYVMDKGTNVSFRATRLVNQGTLLILTHRSIQTGCGRLKLRARTELEKRITTRSERAS